MRTSLNFTDFLIYIQRNVVLTETMIFCSEIISQILFDRSQKNEIRFEKHQISFLTFISSSQNEFRSHKK